MIHHKQSGGSSGGWKGFGGVEKCSSPPENGLLFKEVQIPSQHAACIARCRGGGRVS